MPEKPPGDMNDPTETLFHDHGFKNLVNLFLDYYVWVVVKREKPTRSFTRAVSAEVIVALLNNFFLFSLSFIWF